MLGEHKFVFIRGGGGAKMKTHLFKTNFKFCIGIQLRLSKNLFSNFKFVDLPEVKQTSINVYLAIILSELNGGKRLQDKLLLIFFEHARAEELRKQKNSLK